MGTVSLKDTIMGGVLCINSLLYHPNSDFIEFKKEEKRAKNEKGAFMTAFCILFQKYFFILVCVCYLVVNGSGG